MLRADRADTERTVHDYLEQLKNDRLILSPDRQEALPVEKLARRNKIICTLMLFDIYETHIHQ